MALQRVKVNEAPFGGSCEATVAEVEALEEERGEWAPEGGVM